jgi:hypothetical protein
MKGNALSRRASLRISVEEKISGVATDQGEALVKLMRCRIRWDFLSRTAEAEVRSETPYNSYVGRKERRCIEKCES